jgi:hypothetical protein
MFPRCSHQLAPLTALTSKGTFHWTDVQQRAFHILKAMMIWDCLLQYPDHNKHFRIYTDASDYQLGAVIMQDMPLSGTIHNKFKEKLHNYGKGALKYLRNG